MSGALVRRLWGRLLGTVLIGKDKSNLRIEQICGEKKTSFRPQVLSQVCCTGQPWVVTDECVCQFVVRNLRPCYVLLTNRRNLVSKYCTFSKMGLILRLSEVTSSHLGMRF